MSFVVRADRAGDRQLPDLPALRAQAQRRAAGASLVGAVVLLVTVGALSWSWYRSTPDPWGALLELLPRPLARALAPPSKPPPAPARAPSGRPGP